MTALKKFVAKVDENWRHVYRGTLPKSVRNAINTISPLLAGAYFLGVDPAVVGGTLLVVAGKVLKRGSESEAAAGGVQWKEDLLERGNGFLATIEAEIALSHEDAQNILSSKTDPHWNTFTACVEASASEGSAMVDCYLPFKRAVNAVLEEVIIEVVGSER